MIQKKFIRLFNTWQEQILLENYYNKNTTIKIKNNTKKYYEGKINKLENIIKIYEKNLKKLLINNK